MGRLIRLDQTGPDVDDWILPGFLLRYDQREKPWPNGLFPHDLQIPDFPIQGVQKMLIRRCIEQECQGDVAMERTYTTSSLVWNLWFQLDSDRNRVFDLVISLSKQKDI